MTHADGFRHQALLYAGEDDFVRRATPFLRAGVDAGDAILVVVGDRKIDRLRAALDGDADGIEFADMAGAGRNPARIIPLWRDFVEQNEAAPGLRGIGEPIYPERDADALVECQHHESLLNVAFDGERAFTLVCPYDTRSLGRAVVAEARRSHPYVDDGHAHSSDRYRGYDASARLLDAPLPEPPASALVMPFAHDVLRALRTLVAGRVADLGVTRERGEGFVLAVHELATNSVLYGGGRGVLRLWSDASSVVADVSDSGRIEDPLAGRVLPHPSAERGRGLWLANQFCDLVQIRAYRDGGVVRVRLDL
jgi:anti-sigma regulatory factor (Ser/Thr protein kinase)